MTQLPIDQRMREAAERSEREPMFGAPVYEWSLEVTALIIERDALRRQVEELLSEARHEP